MAKLSELDSGDLVPAPEPTKKVLLSDLGEEPISAPAPAVDPLKVTLPKVEAGKEKPSFIPTTVTNEQMQEIADRKGVPLEIVRNLVDVYGGVREAGMDEVGSGELADWLGGYAKSMGYSVLGQANGMLAGLPAWAFRKYYEKAEGKRELAEAMDEVRKLSEENKSKLQIGSEFALQAALPIGVPFKAAKEAAVVKGFLGTIKDSALKHGAMGAAIGGAYGLGHSELDKEVESFVTGAATGAAFNMALILPFTAAGYATQAAMKKFVTPQSERLLTRLGEDAVTAMEKNAAGEGRYLEAFKHVVEKPESLRTGEGLGPFGREILDLVYGKQQTTNKLKAMATKAGREAVSADDAVELTRQLLTKEVLSTGKVVARLTKAKGRLNPDRAIKLLNENLERGVGSDGIVRTFNMNRLNSYRLAEVERQMPKLMKGVGTTFTKWTDHIMDSQFVMSRIDRTYGSQLEMELTDMVQAHNQSTVLVSTIADNFQSFQKAAKTEKLSNDVIERFLNNGIVPKQASPKQLEILKNMRVELDKVREVANDNFKMNIPYRENFFPNLTVEPNEYMARVFHLEDKLTKKYGDLMLMSKKDFAATRKKDPEFNAYLKALSIVATKPANTQKGLSAALLEVASPKQVAQSLSKLARTSHSRKGEIPEFVREKDVFKTLAKYAGNTMRTGALKPHLEKFESWLPIYERAGDSVTYNYVKRMISDAQGQYAGGLYELGRAFTSKFVTTTRKRALQAAEQGDSVGTHYWNTLSDSPKIFDFITKQFYPNVMGLKLRPVIRNLTQPFTMTATEIGGGTYGQKIILDSIVNDTLPAFRKGSVSSEVRARGFLPSKWRGEVPMTLAEELSSSAINRGYAKAGKALDKFNDASMWMYTGSDAVNRHVTMSAAGRVAKDYLKGNKDAKLFVNRMSPAYSIQIERLQKAGNLTEEALGEVLGKYLIARTQFHYNRLAMSEFGRMMGPVFSVFSKWPTATFGDVVDRLRREGAFGMQHSAAKYMGPLVVLSMFDSAFSTLTESDDDFKKQFFYKKGVSDWAPVHSLKDISPTSLLNPPMIDVGARTINEMLGNNPTGFNRVFDKGWNNYMPLQSYYRFMSKDLPAILKGP